MNRSVPLLGALFALAATGVSIGTASAKPSNGPGSGPVSTVTSISDLTGYQMASDGLGLYEDGLYNGTVDTNVQYGGISQTAELALRTANPSTLANNTRSMGMSFNRPVSGLTGSTSIPDPYGTTHTLVVGTTSVENFPADVRLYAADLFTSTGIKNGTNVFLIFSLTPEFTGPGAFELVFEQPVSVTVSPGNPNGRVLTAGASAVADLYLYDAKGKNNLIGKFYMPFSLTATPAN